MQTFRRDKVEIIVEISFMADIIEILNSFQVTGYTALQTLSGRKMQGQQTSSDFLHIFDTVMIVAVVSKEKTPLILEKVKSLLEETAGIVYTSEVLVVREEKF